MAKAAVASGAEGIRTSQINNIKDIINADLKVPIIGIIKKVSRNWCFYYTYH